MVTLCDVAGSLVTSIPLLLMVNVWEAVPTFVTVMVWPLVTVSLFSEKTKPPAPCEIVPDAFEPVDEPPPYRPPESYPLPESAGLEDVAAGGDGWFPEAVVVLFAQAAQQTDGDPKPDERVPRHGRKGSRRTTS